MKKLLVLKKVSHVSGLTKLKELRSILEEVQSVDPFEHVTESDEEDASPNELLIDQDNDDDMIDIDIQLTLSNSNPRNSNLSLIRTNSKSPSNFLKKLS